MMVMTFDYYYGAQAEQFNFIRIPKAMIVDPMFADLSVNAKLLYGVLLDRMNLSMKNRWFDSENRVYIIYQIAEIMEDFNFSKKTAVRYLNELENFGLVEKKRRGLGLPSLLYVKNFVVFQDHSEPDDTDFDDVAEDDNLNENMETSRGIQGETSRGVRTYTSRSVDMETSKGVQKETLRGAKSELQEVTKRGPLISKTNSNNININNTKESNNILSNPIVKNAVDGMGREEESLFEKYTKMVKDNIDYDVLISRHYLEKSMIDGMVNLIVETIISENDYIIISSTKFPKEAVKSRFSKLDISHIEYVLECMNHNTTNIKNIKKYLLAALYNAPTTIDSYYKARVQHDMPELAN
ncbi:MAG: replication initiator protein A [Eubacterium sp.]|nr:replication initiator protein A [Eubacterium sp.]